MKYFYFLLTIIALMLASCGTQQQTTTQGQNTTEKTEEPVVIANDSLEYEVIIIDPGFTSYLATAKPMSYYSKATLEAKNRVYVSEWNMRARNPLRYNPNIFENEIDYQPDIDYGMEVNYKLYQYFQFAQKKYNFKLANFRID
ncbi:MAG: hypothetical protein CSA39_03600 [Flavobacteriales bacterium]|nr:MAG: hypothetical protein CSA39_03600 [Flavobacteriales bacterium]